MMSMKNRARRVRYLLTKPFKRPTKLTLSLQKCGENGEPAVFVESEGYIDIDVRFTHGFVTPSPGRVVLHSGDTLRITTGWKKGGQE